MAVGLLAAAAFIVAAYFSLPPSCRASTGGFWIENDTFWKDGSAFQIIGGDMHYFRIVPEYWRDRLVRAKALGLNTIQTYVPWNLHEPQESQWEFTGIADFESYLKLAQELGFLVMLRVGPYICGEWDLGGFPAWLLAVEPAIKLRTPDSTFLYYVERWWDVLLPKVAALLYAKGGPVIMVQVENEYGSFGNDRNYLHDLVLLARRHLGSNVILYTTDGGTKSTLRNGTIPRDGVFSAVDFSTGENPWPIFELQKQYNMPGKSPNISTEFYTGWLTHWREKFTKTDANQTATALRSILCNNASAVLYMAHGGTNFGFFSGANTGDNEFDYKADLTSYDYDAPIKESGDVDNPKFEAIRAAIHECTGSPLYFSIPPNIRRASYGIVNVSRIGSIFEALDLICDADKVTVSDQPVAMEHLGQMFGFVLYMSEFEEFEAPINLSIPKVHDRAQVFVSCSLDHLEPPKYIGVLERWSNKTLEIPFLNCSSTCSLYILVENMGRVNYGPYIFDRKGILSPVYLGNNIIHQFKMYPISSDGLKNISKFTSNFDSGTYEGPTFYKGCFCIDGTSDIKDTYISLRGWNKGVALVNNINIGRFWPVAGPQCTLFVPAPFLRLGENVIVLFELEAPRPDLTLELVDAPDFTCATDIDNDCKVI